MLGWFAFIIMAAFVVMAVMVAVGFVVRASRATMNVIDRNDPKSPRYRG